MLNGKVINVGKSLNTYNRDNQYERDLNTLREEIKGREYLLHMLHYELCGYRIEKKILEADIPESQLG